MEGTGQGEHEEQEIRLPRGTTDSLRAVCEQEGFTLNSTVQGAWALLLARYSGVKDVVFGVVRAGRSFAPDSASMVGTFINTLPLRVSIQDDAQVFSWLRQVRESQKAVREFEYLPLSTIQSLSDVPRGTPLFESILVFENYLLNSKMKSEDVDWAHREAHLLERTNYPLTLYGYAEPELILRIAYETGRLGRAAVKRMLGHLKTILEGIASGRDLQVRDLPMLTCEEAQQILETWNQTQVDFPRKKRIHELIEEQVKRSPDAIAVVYNDQRVSYRELDTRASQLARFLQAEGIGAEDRIGICMSRSVDMLVALLAALKSGGAYVPLDPT
jgi:non-ribosomal peptide synthetase component F